MSDLPDLLKIIAGESGRLSTEDRATIRRAADELENAAQQVSGASATVADLYQQMAALMERNQEMALEIGTLRMKPNKPPPETWSMSSGWVECVGWLAPPK